MTVVSPTRLKVMILSNRPGDSPEKKITDRALSLFVEKIDEIAEEVAKESMNGIYEKILPIDIQRGFDNWVRGKLPAEITLKMV